jgi:cell division protease FtsH
VFLGEDLMHTRDYSDETARVIDEEVERILREQEDRCRSVLRDHRGGLDLVARALLEHETIEGTEVDRLIALAANGDGGDGSSAPSDSASADESSHADAGTGAGNGSPATHGNGGEQAPQRSPLGDESRASAIPRPPAPPT